MTPTLAQVDAYPVPELLVPRIMKLYKRDREFADAILREAKRMLLLRCIRKHPVTPSIEIDDAWHEMILFTRFYQSFCKFLGGGFLHHDPEPETPVEDDGTPLYDLTRQWYREEFGSAPDERYWTP
jgi:hypothetical protein